VLFLTAARFFAHLREGRGDGSYEKRLAKLVSIDVLILDDFLLTPLKADEPGDLYELIRLRYERAPLIVTSNRDDKEWTSVFGDALLATAAVDRLLHHAHVIEIDGPSFRNQRRGRKGSAHPLKPTGDAAIATFLDADFQIFASVPEDYDRYVRDVRREYAFLDDHVFRSGRRAFLESLQAAVDARGFFFRTATPFAEWRARQNLSRELRGTLDTND
jgi:hypothetical protein